MSTPVSSQLATRRARLLAIAGGVVLVATPVTLSELLRKPCPVCVECEVCPECEECPEPEPEEGTLLFEERFDDANIRERGWYDGRAIVEDGAAVFRWRVGASLPDSGGAMRIAIPPSEAVSLRYRVRTSPNFVGSGQAYHPHLHYFLGTLSGRYAGLAVSHGTLYAEQNAGRVVFAGQDSLSIGSGAVFGCDSLPFSAPTPECYTFAGVQRNGRRWASAAAPLTPGVWHTVRIDIRLNTVGQNNGSVVAWVDGVEVLRVTDAVLRSREDWLISQYVLGPYLASSPVDQSLLLDDLEVRSLP
jgi:hypothetical protein